jgi:hypothetical protein
MTRIDDLERCPECGASMEVYARTCPACHADLFDAKVSFFREWRDGGGMTDGACEIAIAILGEGAREPRARDEPRERKQVTDLTLDDLERCPSGSSRSARKAIPARTRRRSSLDRTSQR